MAQQKTVFLASDGKEFASEVEADAHDAGLAAADAIKAYVESTKLGKAHATFLTGHIASFLAFRHAQPRLAAEPANG